MPVLNKQIKAFVTYDPFINNAINTVSSIYELSDIANTYAINKQQYYSTADSRYSLHVFKSIDITVLNQPDVDIILEIVKDFSNFVTNTVFTSKQQAIAAYTNDYNSQNPLTPISDLSYSNIIEFNSIKAPDYLTFKVNGITSSIWLSDTVFKTLYPDYEISYIMPFDNFDSIINSPTSFISALDSFNIVEFNSRIDISKNEHPPTYTKIINIPYNVPNTDVVKDCYFAFNIYGAKGNYDYILKLGLLNYLVNLGIDNAYIETIFPTILNINEFFIIPRWDNIALPSYIGQNGINSQITKTYNNPFDLDKFLTVYKDSNGLVDTVYLSSNTYNVPYDYNNILLNIVNGFYSETSIKDFYQYYRDMITVNSSHPDFSRMSTKTQKFLILLENLLQIGDSDTSVEMFNKIVSNTNYNFSITTRDSIDYLSVVYDLHQYYLLPKYKYLELV